MSKFSEFIKENKPTDNIKTKVIEEDISKIIDKYSTYSQDDLMKEFLQETERKKENGELDAEQLNGVKNILMPYLSEPQVERLNQLLDMVNDAK